MNFRPLFFILATSISSGEVLTLTTGARYEGELVSISSENGVLIESARTPEPLALKLDSFSFLEMDGPIEADPLQTERLVLTNGDVLPGNLRSLDTQEIIYEGLVGGKLVLSRDDVTSLRFGIKPQSLQYEGPAPLSEWSGNGSKDWIMSEDKLEGLLLLEPGKMEKEFRLDSQFILKFDLKWQETPGIRIYFGSDTAEKVQQDRYYIDLNSGGLQVKRESSAEQRYQTLVGLERIEAFDDNQVNVELRVNRLIGTIDLYLDGELIRQMQDSATPTKGNFIIVERGKGDSSVSYLSNLQLFSWDAVSQIELMEEPGDGNVDSLVNSEGGRNSGKLLGMFPKEEADAPSDEEQPEASHFLLQSPFADQAVKIPTAKTRIIYFQTSIGNAISSEFPKYELELANDGVVSATALTMDDEELVIEHPLLGSLSVARSAVKQIRYYEQLTDEDE